MYKKHKNEYAMADRQHINTGFDRTISFVDKHLARWADLYPAPSSIDLVYADIENNEWTTSFWPGMVWLAYQHTGEEKYKVAGQHHTHNFEQRLKNNIALDHHDIGFLYILTAIADYRCTGNEAAKALAIKAADKFCTRYYEKPGILQAWGPMDDAVNKGRIIIDCLMNLPLLYFAAEETGNTKYYDIAHSHAKQAAKYLVREDSTSFHTYFFDVDTGEALYGKTHQGAFDDSCWARGQAWGIYGFTLSYKYTKDPMFLEIAQKMTDYFLEHQPSDGVCYWDLYYQDGAYQPRDSSAMAIAGCGMLELLKYIPLGGEKFKWYSSSVAEMYKVLTDKYLAKAGDDGILLHSTYAKNPTNVGVDEFNSWGDYYYMELAMRLGNVWDPYW